MKKIYLQPVTETVELEGRALINDSNGTGTGKLSEESVTGDAWSRDYDWDD